MSKQLLCRYYAQGICNFDDNCIYSHDPNNSIPIPDTVCLFYLRSYCMNGENCSKEHKSIDELLSDLSGNTDVVSEANDELSNCANKKVLILNITSESESETSNATDIQNAKPVIASDDDDAVKSYASVASTSQPKEDPKMASRELCTFYENNGFCVMNNCKNVHGNFCDLCGFYCLHPFSETQQERHRQECVREHEKNMEESFAYQRSKDLTCGICLDVVMDKESRKGRRFGILENCLHVYCIECIRTWRNSNFDKKNKRGCPQCRIKSDFVIPSEYFYEDKSDKMKLIDEYKDALSKQHCKYFKQGQGKCPFEGACFYKHEYPDGRKAELPMPTDRRRIKGANGIAEDYAALLSLFMDVDSLRHVLSEGEIDISDYEDILFLED